MPSTILAKFITFPRCGKVAPTPTLKSAMTERLCSYDQDDLEARGKVSPEYVKLYEEWGKGQIGIIVLGNIPVERRGLEAKGNCIIDKQNSWDPVEQLRPAIAGAKAHGSLVIGQLTHGGRQVSEEVDPHPVSASDVQLGPTFGMTFGKPRPLTVAEIDTLVEHWGYAAKVLHESGADGCQLHAAHGYLLSQFLSARTNKRTDDYGGSIENRSRIIFRVIEEIKKQVPADFLLSIKINSADFSDGGMTTEESQIVCERLDAAGIDLIELSGGTYEQTGFEHKKESTKAREAFFLEFAEALKPKIKTALVAVTGGFRSKKAIEQALESGACDIVGFGRPLTAEPTLITDMIAGKTEAAKENKVPAGVQTATAIAQIGAISRGQPIPDLSIQEVADATLAAALGQKPAEKPAGEAHNTEASYEKL